MSSSNRDVQRLSWLVRRQADQRQVTEANTLTSVRRAFRTFWRAGERDYARHLAATCIDNSRAKTYRAQWGYLQQASEQRRTMPALPEKGKGEEMAARASERLASKVDESQNVTDDATFDEALDAVMKRLEAELGSELRQIDLDAAKDFEMAQPDAKPGAPKNAARKPAGRIIGWRRVIHPELSRGRQRDPSYKGTCGLCVAASQRTYSRKDLKKIHENCNCAVVPITTLKDPGKLLNEQDLKSLYAASDGTNAQSLSRVRISAPGEITHAPLTRYRSAAQREQEAKREARQQRLADMSAAKFAKRVKNLEDAIAQKEKAAKPNAAQIRALKVRLAQERDRLAQAQRREAA